MHGKGRLIKPSGLTYEGMFKDGKYSGPGSLNYPGGVKFEGTFEEGYKVKGRITYLNGSFYEGSW